MEMKWKRRR